MAKRSGPVHVATTTRRYKDRVYQSHLLRRTFREDGKVKHETLGNLSHLPEAVIELIRRALRGESLVAASDAFEILRSLPHGHVLAVLGTLRKLGVERLLDAHRSRERDLITALLVLRILDPVSKLASARELDRETASSSLGEALDLGLVTEDELYGAMDWLGARQERIERALGERHLDEGSLVLYDVSSSYYTGSHCSLAKFGHNRDGKERFPQIVYGLLCDRRGCPVAIEVFPGNTADPNTLGEQIQTLRKRFGLRRVILVGDRGMITEARLREEIEPIDGLDWITALRAPAIQKLAEQKSLQMSLFDRRDLAEIRSPDYPGERLIACYNPILAEDRQRTRLELLAATQAHLDAIVAATRRIHRPLRGRDAIALRVGKVIDRHRVAKHFQLTITETGFAYELDREGIAREAAVDGIYVLRTSVPARQMPAEQTVLAYKSLASVERAFRSLKTVDLKIRPIHHRTEKRIRAHVFLCMLAYYVEWHMREALAPILFDDEQPALAQTLRKSAVAPARRSPGAEAKASSRRTPDGFPVHSFQTLLTDLATLTRNRVRHGESSSESFELLASPTPTQRRALELLGIPLAL